MRQHCPNHELSDINAVTCCFLCKFCQIWRHTMAQYLGKRFGASLKHPYAQLMDVSLANARSNTMVIEKVWVVIPHLFRIIEKLPTPIIKGVLSESF
ncbi:hypothetical protein Aduo_019201 [Ancylostoma duodenale]